MSADWRLRRDLLAIASGPGMSEPVPVDMRALQRLINEGIATLIAQQSKKKKRGRR